MNLDSIAKRGFPIIVGSMIATAAYFQAAGISALIGNAIGPDKRWVTRAPARPAPPLPREPGSPEKSAAPILARNPFDSVTGPLFPPPAGSPEGPAAGSDGEAPPCDAGRVLLIAGSEDEAWSFAVIQEPDGRARLRRRGDDAAGRAVERIAWDRVVLSSGGARCQLALGSPENKPKAGPSPEAPSAMPAAQPARKSSLPPEIAARIQRVSDTEFNVDRTAFNALLDNQAVLMNSARVMPVMRDGEVYGVKLKLKKDSPFKDLGLKTGDTLHSINGFNVTDPQKALEAYARLRTENRLSVAIERDGKPMNLDFNIR